mmetsp:Transcript_55968/g.109538  ORF Transcript_55968/g.109538 Transcript_55968/m.109538 type:complete len:713 (+) Transcript_55968:202-2340(+)
MPHFLMKGDNAPTGRVVVGSDLRHLPKTSVSLSIHQAEKNVSDGEGLYWTCDSTRELPIRLASEGYGAAKPRTLMECFSERVVSHPDLKALAYKKPGSSQWLAYSWQEYWDACCGFAKSLIAIGFAPRQCLSIMGWNAPPWLIAHFGGIFADGVPTGIYATNGPDATKYIIQHTQSAVAVVDTLEQVDKFNEVWKECPFLKYVVVYLEDVPAEVSRKSSDRIISWDAFMKLGGNVHDDELFFRMGKQTPGHCCSLIYTSGTTSFPKGVMVSHDNCVWTGYSGGAFLGLGPNDRIVSFLPLSHIAAQIIDIYGPLHFGTAVFFANPDALKGTLVDTLREARPTMFFAVPRVWEKIEEKMKAVGAATTGVKKAVAEWAKGVTRRSVKRVLLGGRDTAMGFTAANVLLGKAREAIGLDQCKVFYNGAAPIRISTVEYFMSLGMPICDAYGMSECTGPEVYAEPRHGAYKLGSIGRPMQGTELMIANPDGKGHGEICWRGRNVFMGYYKNAEATRSTVDEHGFLHSGDLGFVDSDGFVFITGRLKELIITAGGENIPPVLIETAIREELPFVSNCQLIGDHRRFLSVLLCLRSEPDAEGQPTDTLAAQTVQLLKEGRSRATTVTDARNCPVLHRLIDEGMRRVNRRAISRAQYVQKWRVLPTDFTQEGGELTPTMKLKRSVTAEKYCALVEEMYSSEEDAHPGGIAETDVPAQAKL